jgi:hypothetical protein
MTELIKAWGCDSPKERYNLSKEEGTSLAELAGKEVNISAYLLIRVVNDVSGEVTMRFVCRDTDGHVHGTSGAAFIAGVTEYLAMMGKDDLPAFKVGTKTSKAGRKYIIFLAC